VSVAGSDLESVEFDLWELRYRHPAKMLSGIVCRNCVESPYEFEGGCRDAKEVRLKICGSLSANTI